MATRPQRAELIKAGSVRERGVSTCSQTCSADRIAGSAVGDSSTEKAYWPGRALREFETTDPRVPDACGRVRCGVVHIRVPEGAVIDWIDSHVAVIAPATETG